MKHYFAGLTNPGMVEYAKQRVGHWIDLRLFSYWYQKDWEIQAEWYQQDKPYFLDSGAYSAFTKGVQIDPDQYIGYINLHDEHLTCFAQLDKIPGEAGRPKTSQDLAEAPELSWQNYMYMLDRVKSPTKLLPVFHYGSDFEYLRRILNHRVNGEPVDYLAFGALVGVPTRERDLWIDKAFRTIAASSNTNVKVHGLGMTSLDLLSMYPFYSADSTSWVMVGSAGNIMTKYGTIVVSKQGRSDPNHILNRPKDFQDEVAAYVAQFGFTLEELGDNYKPRLLFNILYVMDWASRYQYKPRQVSQNKLF